MNTSATPTFKIQIWQELAAFTFIIMETSWIAAWLRAQSPSLHAVPLPRFMAMLVFFSFSAYLLTRAVRALRLQTGVQRVVLGGLLLLNTLLTWNFLAVQSGAQNFDGLYQQSLKNLLEVGILIPARFWGLLAAIALWWRGISLAGERIGPMFVSGNFRAGILMFALYGVFGIVFKLAQDTPPLLLLFTFLLAALLSMGAARVSFLHVLRGGGRSPFDRRWLAALSSAALGVVSIATGLAALVSGQAGFLYNLLAQLFLWAGILVAAPILLPLWWLSPEIQAFQSAQPILTPPPTPFPGEEEVTQAAPQIFNQPTFVLPPELHPWLMALGLLVIALLLLWGVRAATRYINRRDDGLETLLEQEDLARKLRQSLRNQMQDAANLLTRTPLSARQRTLAAARIRKLYLNLLTLCLNLNIPREQAQTPLEFLVTLQEHFPELRTEAATMTHAYQRVRYGELPETAEEVAAVEGAWERLRTAGSQ
ncbi:MAG: hypothetical protein OHK0052_15030 [Anaerolineales bacterium]